MTFSFDVCFRNHKYDFGVLSGDSSQIIVLSLQAKTQVVPSYYTMILEPLDGHQEQNLMINISVERSGEMVNMSVDGEIPTKTLWNASLLAYGCQSDTVVKVVELSEFDRVLTIKLKLTKRFHIFQALMIFRTSQSLPLNLVKSE